MLKSKSNMMIRLVSTTVDSFETKMIMNPLVLNIISHSLSLS